MRLMHLSDLHLGKNVNGFPMLEDQEYILKQILNIADEQRVQAVLLCGDIYDRPVPPEEAVRLFDRFLTALANRDLPVFIISGNHDSPQRLSFGAHLMENRRIYLAGVLEGTLQPVTLEDEYGEIAFYQLPFVKPVHVRNAYRKISPEYGENRGPQFTESSEGDGMDFGERGVSDPEESGTYTDPERSHFQEPQAQEKQEERDPEIIRTYQDAIAYVIDRMEVDPRRRNVILAHQFVTGAMRSESETVNVGGTDNIDAALFDAFDYAALGHIHRAQAVGRETVRYCGTPLKYSFSEAGQEKSVTIVDMKEKGTVDITEVPLIPLRDLREIRGSYEELTLRKNYIDTNTEDYLHVTLTDEEDILDVMSKLRMIYPNIMKLDYDNVRTSGAMQVEADGRVQQKSPLELIGEFYLLQNNQEMSGQQSSYIRKLLEDMT